MSRVFSEQASNPEPHSELHFHGARQRSSRGWVGGGPTAGAPGAADLHGLLQACFRDLRTDVELAIKKRQDALQHSFEQHSMPVEHCLSAPPANNPAAGPHHAPAMAHSTNTESFMASEDSWLAVHQRPSYGLGTASKQSTLSAWRKQISASSFEDLPHSLEDKAARSPRLFPHQLSHGGQQQPVLQPKETAAHSQVPGRHVLAPEAVSPDEPGGQPPHIRFTASMAALRAIAKAREAWSQPQSGSTTVSPAASPAPTPVDPTSSRGSRAHFQVGEHRQTGGTVTTHTTGNKTHRSLASFESSCEMGQSFDLHTRSTMHRDAHRRLTRMKSLASEIEDVGVASRASLIALGSMKEPTRSSFGPRAMIMEFGSKAEQALYNFREGRRRVDYEEMSSRRRIVKRCLSHWLFDAVVGAIIALNCVTVGLETQNAAQGKETPQWVETCEIIFLGIYTVELGMRLFAYRLTALRSGWTQFDALLVGCGLLELVLHDQFTEGSSDLNLNSFIWLRILRLARLARSLRLFVQFRVLWLLVEGLINSFNTVCSTFLVIAVLLYIFSVVALEVIAPGGDVDYEETREERFGSLGRSMLTLLQFTTLDAAAAVYEPLVSSRPLLAIYVIIFMLVVSIAAMNLVTAQVVESALQMAKRHRQGKAAMQRRWKQTLIPKLQKLFEELDADGSGELELDELLNAPENVKEELMEIVGMDEVVELFEALDTDGSGTVGVDEFCETVVNTAEDKPLEMIHIMKLCRYLVVQSNNLGGALATMEASLHRLESAMGLRAVTPPAHRPKAINRTLAVLDEQWPPGRGSRESSPDKGEENA